MTLLLASWNVNSVRMRLEHVLHWMRLKNPDILLLQEIKAQSHQFPTEAFEDLGYNVALFGQKTYNGVAILSKRPLEDVQMGLISKKEGDVEEARYIEAFTHNIRVASIYVPNGQEPGSAKFSYKLEFLKNLKTHLETLLSHQEILVLGGDFNIAPADGDVYDPALWHEKILCTSKERQAFQSLLHMGFSDALRVAHPHETLYTWWDYRQNAFQRDHGLRIDHFLLSPQAVDVLKDAGVEKQERALLKASDHAPVWITLDI